MKLEGKISIVTGGGRGIGRAIAHALAEEGSDVVVAARTVSEIESVAEEIRKMGRRAIAVRTDVSKEADVNNMVEKTIKEFGRIDALFNNAGTSSPRIPLHEILFEEWKRVIDTNLHGSFLCCKAVLPYMLRQKSGVIVNVSSGLGRRPKGEYGAYVVSKAGIEGLTQLIASETVEYGIRVNAMRPGLTKTRLAEITTPKSVMITRTPEDSKSLAIFLASDDSKGLTGVSIGFSPEEFQPVFREKQ